MWFDIEYSLFIQHWLCIRIICLFSCCITVVLKMTASYFSATATGSFSYLQVFNSLLYNTPKNNFTMETIDHDHNPHQPFRPRPHNKANQQVASSKALSQAH
jgi:hypothetical protein